MRRSFPHCYVYTYWRYNVKCIHSRVETTSSSSLYRHHQYSLFELSSIHAKSVCYDAFWIILGIIQKVLVWTFSECKHLRELPASHIASAPPSPTSSFLARHWRRRRTRRKGLLTRHRIVLALTTPCAQTKATRSTKRKAKATTPLPTKKRNRLSEKGGQKKKKKISDPKM